jgi:hypothetical protein
VAPAGVAHPRVAGRHDHLRQPARRFLRIALAREAHRDRFGRDTAARRGAVVFEQRQPLVVADQIRLRHPAGLLAEDRERRAHRRRKATRMRPDSGGPIGTIRSARIASRFRPPGASCTRATSTVEVADAGLFGQRAQERLRIDGAHRAELLAEPQPAFGLRLERRRQLPGCTAP